MSFGQTHGEFVHIDKHKPKSEHELCRRKSPLKDLGGIIIVIAEAVQSKEIQVK